MSRASISRRSAALESTPAESERSFEALWPLFEWRDSAAFEELYIRPIYNRRTDKAQKITESDWLWPFGFGTGRTDVNRQVIYPLFLHEKGTASDGTPESRTILLPLLYQHSGHGVSDLLIFPFGGVIHNFLDRQKIVIVLWPIYTYQRSREAQDWSILFPIFSYIRWDDGSRGFKFWPLFGINRRPNKLYRLFVLWPIIHYEDVILPQGTIHAWAFWPFYSTETGPGGWDWSVAWPFISGHFERNETQHWFPWPFLGRLTGEKVSGWTFWPAFSIAKRPEKTDGYYLWPLGWFSRKNGSGHGVLVPAHSADVLRERDAAAEISGRAARLAGGAGGVGRRDGRPAAGRGAADGILRRVAGLAAGEVPVRRGRRAPPGSALALPAALVRAVGAEFRAVLPRLRIRACRRRRNLVAGALAPLARGPRAGGQRS